MEVRPAGDGYNVIGECGKILVRGIATETAAVAWIKDNAPDYPINWEHLKRGGR